MKLPAAGSSISWKPAADQRVHGMVDLGRLAAAMGGEVSGQSVKFPTPGHSKKDRGSVATLAPHAPDGLLVNSFNGGDALAIKDELRDKGLLPPRESSRDEWTVTGTFEFQDESGAVLFRTRRFEHPSKPKRYEAHRSDGNGGWLSGLKGSRCVLYRLPELLAADRAEVVYLVEGERKADKLATMGFLATSVAFGCKGWRESYADILADRTVIILPDNDDPGREFAKTVQAAIKRAGGSAHLLELPGLPEKGDIMDWTGSADGLRSLAQAALKPRAQLLPMFNLLQWAASEAPQRKWALKGLIPLRQATYLTGAGSAGKSLFSQQLCTCIALGLPFLGIETRQAVAIYVTCEDDEDELHRRQKAICEALGVSLEDLHGKLHLVSLAGALNNELATFDANGSMIVSNAFKTLQDTVSATGAGFLVLDNVAQLFAGNENIRNQVAAFCSLLNQIAHGMNNGAVLFLGHPNKAGANFSGSTAWENQVRSRLFMEVPKNADASLIDPDARVLTLGKANYARNGETLEFRWHRWAYVREDSLSSQQRSELASHIHEKAAEDVFLRCLNIRRTQGASRGVGPSPGPNYAPSEFEKMEQAEGIKSPALRQAMERLLDKGRIELFEHQNTVKGRKVTHIRDTGSIP